MIRNVILVLAIAMASVSSFGEEKGKNSGHAKDKAPHANANPVLEGTIVKKTFLRVRTSDGSFKEYLIDTTNENSKKAMEKCKEGEKCSIRGRIDENIPSIVAEFVRSLTVPSGTKTTKTGKTFTRDFTYAALGEAWRDPSGMIWGDMAENSDFTPKLLSHKKAIEYCEDLKDAKGNKIGAKLASKEDFERLREYMGAEPGTNKGYEAQILPNLTYEIGEETWSRYFWTSTLLPDNKNYAFDFFGKSGNIDASRGDVINSTSHVRCVVDAKIEK